MVGLAVGWVAGEVAGWAGRAEQVAGSVGELEVQQLQGNIPGTESAPGVVCSIWFVVGDVVGIRRMIELAVESVVVR